MNKIFFTADLHFGHTNILKHQPDRPFAQEGDTKAHDEYMLDLWKSSVGKRDLVYILGDLTFFKSEDARHLLEKLPGQKFLVQGNHDGSIRAYSNYFKTTAQILDLTIKPTACPFLTENLQLTLCHYPMVTWNKKPHCELAKKAGGLVPLELIYETAMEKTGGVPFHQYAKQNYRSEVR